MMTWRYRIGVCVIRPKTKKVRVFQMRGGVIFFFSSRRRHTRLQGDWSSDVCSSDLAENRGQRSEVRGRKREAGSGKWEAGSGKGEAENRGQRSEVRRRNRLRAS